LFVSCNIVAFFLHLELVLVQMKSVAFDAVTLSWAEHTNLVLTLRVTDLTAS
jgi:hypothetical protein